MKLSDAVLVNSLIEERDELSDRIRGLRDMLAPHPPGAREREVVPPCQMRVGYHWFDLSYETALALLPTILDDSLRRIADVDAQLAALGVIVDLAPGHTTTADADGNDDEADGEENELSDAA